jgi:alkylation response protein AidB-like acyl-CoA dehydrogenase
MDFGLTQEQRTLQDRCLALAETFIPRSAEHDRDASHPTENYDRLRAEGFLALTIPKSYGGQGHSFLDHTIAYEALGQGCPATALAFNMHASVVMPLLDSPEVTADTKKYIADLVVTSNIMIGGNFSEPGHTSLLGERPLTVTAKKIESGYSITGRKMFASMLEAADYVLVLCYPEDATAQFAGTLLMIPHNAPGRHVLPDWDTLGMRATRSDSLVLKDCRVTDQAMVYRSDDIRPFRLANFSWFWGSYTAVYLGVAVAACNELRRTVSTRQPAGYSQPLSYHPDTRRHIAELTTEIEAARLITYRSAWLYDTEGPTPNTTNELFRSKLAVGRAVSTATRIGLTLGGAHGIYKGTRMEQLFRDGALAELHAPPTDFCLWSIGQHELNLNPDDVLPPMRRL